MVVLEAILVALLVLSAILYVTSVQRPIVGGDAGGVDLATLSSQTLQLLSGNTFVDASGERLAVHEWVNLTLQGDPAMVARVDRFVSEVLPVGTRYTLTLTNGVGELRLAPALDPGEPRNAQAAEVPFFPPWSKFRHAASTEWAIPGAPVARHNVLLNFTGAGPTALHCIKAPNNSTLGPGAVPWTTSWQGRTTVPEGALYGRWAGYTDAACTAGAQYVRIALRNGTQTDMPLYGLRLVVWFGA